MPNTITKATTLSNKTYDVLKPITQIWLPALAALYYGLAEIWNFPEVDRVVGSIAVIITFLGVILGVSTKKYRESTKSHYDGALIVNETDPHKDVYTLELDVPLFELPSKTELKLRIPPQE